MSIIFRFTVNEIDTIVAVLNYRSTNGSLIRDVRLIDKIVKKLDYAKPIAPYDSSVDAHGEDEKKTLKEEYLEDLKAYPLILCDIDLTETELNVIKNKISTFSGFLTDSDSRTSTLVLADKLGV
jgi:hypothetical protein